MTNGAFQDARRGGTGARAARRMKGLARRSLDRCAALLSRLARAVDPDPQAERVAPWFRDDGDRTLRLDYDLDHDSIVFDLGGYQGQWASDIFSRYLCSVYVFEVAPRFAEALEARFRRNERIRVFAHGLGPRTESVDVALDRDGTSVFRTASQTALGRLEMASEFLDRHRIERIDLMKINIEGGEYDLLEHFIASGRIRIVRNIQVQFHDFMPRAEERMAAIQAALERTHTLTWQYRFVWENWQLRPGI